MKTSFKIAIVILVLIGIAAGAVLFCQTHNIAVLNPKGMIGIAQRDLIATSSLLMCIVVIPALIMTVLFAWKYREKNRAATYSPEWSHSYLAECVWWGVPCIIITVLAVITWTSSHALNPFRPIENGKKPLVIQVVALDWKWLFIYPEEEIATVNYIRFPVHTPIDFQITSDGPMNSFWIPQLGGQIYAMAAMKTQLHLIANAEGTFRGCSANLSGEGFAGMTFTAQASSDEEFTDWVESVKRSGKPLGLEQYRTLAEPSKNNPTAVYTLSQHDLFDQIIMKYMHPDSPLGKKR